MKQKRQKSKPARDGPQSPRISQGEKHAAPVESSPPQNLAGWIEYLETEFLKLTPNIDGEVLQLSQRMLQTMRQAGKDFNSRVWEKPNRQWIEQIVGDLPKQPTFSEALNERLLIAWADPKLWRIIRADPKYLPRPHTIDDYIQSWLLHRYHLAIQIPASVWCEMVSQPAQREYLFGLLILVAPRFFWVRSLTPKDDLPTKWRNELSCEKLGALLNKYVQNPVQDWRPSLVLEGYPEEVLEWLRFAVNRLADDIAHVIQHPKRFDARRAPPVPHRMRSLAEVKSIEEMVEKLRCDGQISDGALAKESMGRITAAGRRLAHEARLLAHYRDCLPVKFHKSRGHKNTPTSSA
jgi:hypothetical protein